MERADKPKASGGVSYHTHTGPNDLAAMCLIVGAPGRADMIAEKYLKGSRRFSNDARGLVSHTGKYRDIDISVTTSGMGGPSMGIVLPEAVQSGARIFIRVGSCGSLIRESKIGDVIIPTAAIRFDRTADDWAPPEYPAVADWRVVSALHRAAQAKAPGRFHAGVECTTSDFYTGQGRPNLFGVVPDRMKARHQEVLRLGAACYSMEAVGFVRLVRNRRRRIARRRDQRCFRKSAHQRMGHGWGGIGGGDRAGRASDSAAEMPAWRRFCHANAPSMLERLAEAQSYARPAVSGYRVGAVVRGTSGALYLGANIEFPGEGLGQTVHAEQAALSNAFMHDEPGIEAIAVSAAPCGHLPPVSVRVRCGPRYRNTFARAAGDRAIVPFCRGLLARAT